MLEWNLNLLLWVLYNIKDLYMDKLYTECEDRGDEPIVVLWLHQSTTLNKYLDG